MQETTVRKFKKEREALNEIVLRYGGKNIKRFFTIDTQVYEEGALPTKHKELLGLVSSLVLRCDDCITYHILQCKDAGVSDAELEETLAIGLVAFIYF